MGITLFVIAGIALLLLLAGEALVNTVTVLVATLASFMAFLFLWQWACSSTIAPMEGGVKCILPFVLACVCALIIAALTFWLIKKAEWVIYFVMGAAGGAVAMYMLRQFIIAGNPQLAFMWQFNFFWLGLALVAIFCGLLAVRLRSVVIRTVTCLL